MRVPYAPDFKFGIDVAAKIPPSWRLKMPDKFVAAIRACGIALALGLGSVGAAAEPASPLIGATREQILARLGEPKSQMAAGDRIIFFYPRERLVLRGDVVIEVEPIAAEPVRRPPPAEAPTDAPGVAAPTGPSIAPATVPAESTPPAPPEPKVEIKLVRPPSAKDGRPTAIVPPATSIPVAPKPETKKEEVKSAGPSAEALEAQAAEKKKVEALAKAARDEAEARKAAERAAAIEKEKQAKAAREARRRLDHAADGEVGAESSSTGRWIAIGVVGAGLLGFLLWRLSQRQVAAPKSVPAPVPVAAAGAGAATPAPGASGFTAQFLASLEPKRFEALVAAYYNKTGVVAERANHGPAAPFQLKISWKGEPRPFAYVQCLAQPTGSIDVKTLKELLAALAKDDIRRGHSVTSGKFNDAAQELAKQKQLTLLPGDVFLEKLNALPASARKEIVQESSAV